MKIFASYSHQDKAFVDRFLTEFKKRAQKISKKLSIWIDENEILPGDQISLKVLDGLGNAEVFLLFLSRNYLHSEWTRREMNAILGITFSKPRLRIVPIVIDDVEPISLLAGIYHLDARDGINNITEDQWERLLKAIGAMVDDNEEGHRVVHGTIEKQILEDSLGYLARVLEYLPQGNTRTNIAIEYMQCWQGNYNIMEWFSKCLSIIESEVNQDKKEEAQKALIELLEKLGKDLEILNEKQGL